jgi:hypothetical protein
VLARAAVEEAGARGVSVVRAEAEQIVLAMRGVSGPVEIAEIEPHQTFADVSAARVIWKGDVSEKITLPRFEGTHDRLASGFVALVPHAVRGRVPAGAARASQRTRALFQRRTARRVSKCRWWTMRSRSASGTLG